MEASISDWETDGPNRRSIRGVSTVLGVILMITVTIVLAAIVGTFVFDIGEAVQESPPNVQLTVEWDGSNDERLTITHANGETIESTELRLVGPNSTVGFADGTAIWNERDWDEEIVAGDSGTIGNVESMNGTALDTGDGGTYRIVWEGDGVSTTIKTFERPG